MDPPYTVPHPSTMIDIMCQSSSEPLVTEQFCWVAQTTLHNASVVWLECSCSHAANNSLIQLHVHVWAFCESFSDGVRLIQTVPVCWVLLRFV